MTYGSFIFSDKYRYFQFQDFKIRRDFFIFWFSLGFAEIGAFVISGEVEFRWIIIIRVQLFQFEILLCDSTVCDIII